MTDPVWDLPLDERQSAVSTGLLEQLGRVLADDCGDLTQLERLKFWVEELLKDARNL